MIWEVKYGELLEMNYFFICHIFCQVAKLHVLPTKFWQTLGDALTSAKLNAMKLMKLRVALVSRDVKMASDTISLRLSGLTYDAGRISISGASRLF